MMYIYILQVYSLTRVQNPILPPGRKHHIVICRGGVCQPPTMPREHCAGVIIARLPPLILQQTVILFPFSLIHFIYIYIYHYIPLSQAPLFHINIYIYMWIYIRNSTPLCTRSLYHPSQFIASWTIYPWNVCQFFQSSVYIYLYIYV